jgi:hypothetical protein
MFMMNRLCALTKTEATVMLAVKQVTQYNYDCMRSLAELRHHYTLFKQLTEHSSVDSSNFMHCVPYDML